MFFQPLPTARRSPLLCLIAVLLFAPLAETRLSATERSEELSTAPPVDPPDAPDETLIRRHNELAPRVKLLWQQRKDREALQGLEQLLALYQQIYPAAKYPDGHPHIVRCYRDLCRVTDELGEYESQWKYCQDGLAMCRRLFPRDKYPQGNPDLASMLANMGNALVRKCQYAAAREYLMEAIREQTLLGTTSHAAEHRRILANLHCFVATAFEREGCLHKTVEHTALALKESNDLPVNYPHLDRWRAVSECLYLHGRSLRGVGSLTDAAVQSQKSLEMRLKVFLIDRSQMSHLALIDSLLEIGVLLRQKSQLPESKFHLERANREIDQLELSSEDVISRKLNVLAHLLWLAEAEQDQIEAIRRREELETLLEWCSTKMTKAVDSAMRAEIEMEIGLSFRASGNLTQAESCLQRARDLFDGVIDHAAPEMTHPNAVYVNCCLGKLYQDLGRYQEAYHQFAKALQKAQILFPTDRYPSGHILLLTSLENLATHLWLLGETEIAAALFSDALAMAERLFPCDEYPRGHRLLIPAYSGWANVLMREGAFDLAETYLHKARDIATSQFPASRFPHGHDQLALIWRDLGVLELACGRLETAKAFFEKAMESYQQRYSSSFPAGHLAIALTWAELGRTATAAGHYEEAAECHRQSLALRRRLFPVEEYPTGHPSLATSLRDLSSVYRSSGRYDEAFQQFGESVRMEHAIANSFFGGSSEALLLNLAARRFRSLDYLLDSWHQTARPASEAYEYVWMRRGFVPRIVAQRNRAFRMITSVGQSVQFDKYMELRREISRVLLVSATQDDGAILRLDRMRELNASREVSEHQLTQPLHNVARVELRDQSTPQQLAECLPADAVLIDYVRYSNSCLDSSVYTAEDPKSARMLGFVITHANPIACVDLGEADRIEKLVERWQQAVLDDREDTAGELLRQLVWDPVSGFFPAETRTVYVAPDGALSLVAWGALPSPADARLLIESYAIATVPHGPFLVEQLRRQVSLAAQPNQVLAVGDVDYGVPGNATLTGPLGLKQVQWLPLQASALEIASVSAAAGERNCVLLTGADATPSQVMTQLPCARWAHFATHGFFVDNRLGMTLQLASNIPGQKRLSANPSRSTVLGRNPFVRCGVALSGANELGPLDELGVPLCSKGILTAEEIAVSDCRQLELVVLSACETGCGDVVHGDGVFSIQTAFHVAGARNVIATLWKIDDAATAELMREFYRLLWEEARSPLEALRGAQLHMLQNIVSGTTASRGPVLSDVVPLPKGTKQPAPSTTRGIRKWAGFVLSGPGF